MPGLNEQDREWVKAVAKEIAFEAIKETLSLHIKACPHGQQLSRGRAMIIGLVIGLAAASGGLGYLIAKIPWPL